MKKIVIYIAVVAILLSPITASAQTDEKAGIQFLSPLVQNIIQLLYDRIAELTNQIELLKLQKGVVFVDVPQQCPAFSGVEVKQTNPRIEFLNNEIYKISLEIIAKDRAIDDANRERTLAGGSTASQTAKWNRTIEQYAYDIQVLQNNRETLASELNYLRLYE